MFAPHVSAPVLATMAGGRLVFIFQGAAMFLRIGGLGRAICSVLLMTALAGCAASGKLGPQSGWTYPLAEQATVELRLPREEIGVHVPQSNPGVYGGGLLGALIATAVDSSRANKAEERVAEIRNQLVGQDYRLAASEAFNAHFDRVLLAPQVEVLALNESEAESIAAKRAPPRADLLLVQHDYYFLRDFSTLRVELHARLGDRVTVNNRERVPEVRYVNSIYYDFQLPPGNAANKPEERAAAWLALGGERIDSMIREGLSGTVQMLSHELAGGPGESTGQKIKLPMSDFDGDTNAVVVHELGERRWARFHNTRQLASVPAP